MDNFYRENILDHYRNPRNFGPLVKSDLGGEDANISCGDRIGIQIKVKSPFGPSSVREFTPRSSGRGQKSKVKNIEDIRFYGEGCAISMASASLLTEKVKGMEVEKVKKLGRKDILNLLGIELTPTRLKCALLSLEVLQKVVNLPLARK